jgi:hypothetical protein
VAAPSPLELTASKKSGKTSVGTIRAGWRSVRRTERRPTNPIWWASSLITP